MEEKNEELQSNIVEEMVTEGDVAEIATDVDVASEKLSFRLEKIIEKLL